MRRSAVTLGRTTPRLWTRPLVVGAPGPCGCGCALTPETSLGFSAVEFAEQVVGFTLLPWQRWLLIHGMELRPDGRFRFRTLLVLVARQNGKTSLVEVKNLWKMYVLGAQVLGTAQDLDVSEESWDNAVEIAQAIPELAAEVRDVIRVNGKKALKLANGARWKVKAANRRGGRGFTGDDVNLDELREHQNWNAWGAVTKTTMARANAQIWAVTNAGDDDSIVLNDLQRRARATVQHSGDEDSLGLFEWSVPDDVTCDCGRRDEEEHAASCRLQDRELWAQANPAYGYTVSDEALASALTTDPDEIFCTECLCKRVPSLTPKQIPAEAWAKLGVDIDPPDGPRRFFVDCSPGLSSGSIGVAVDRDGKPHVELADYRPRTEWIVARAVELAERYPDSKFAAYAGGAAVALLPKLTDAGIEVHLFTGQEMGRACAHLQKLVTDAGLTHSGDALFGQALDGAVKRDLGDDLWMWSRRKSTDISPIVAATGAAWLLEVEPAYDLLDSVY